MSTGAGVEVVLRYLAASNAGDRAAVEELLADDATFTLWGRLPVSGTTVGKRAIVESLMPGARKLFQPGTLQLQPLHVMADGDHVVAEVHAEGTSAAGLAYDTQYCMVFQVCDGQIHVVREYMDTSYAETVLCPHL
ncbi:nuclear transport factor 2 family protein [Nocardia sp. NBC_01730]|uniref:nuclear transport factor 2 family protein n=1 Tax=Nocardia sp. NBC_01730 TaxID=2975998 RepID=UPI002E156CC2|nr:nuclear transport factor 2 family protein [Nocardia sp. NBC_01730]